MANFNQLFEAQGEGREAAMNRAIQLLEQMSRSADELGFFNLHFAPPLVELGPDDGDDDIDNGQPVTFDEAVAAIRYILQYNM